MKKNIFLILLICIATSCFAYSKPAKAKAKTDSVTGYINVYGNEPFTFIGIVTDDDKQYTITADDSILKELRKTQGKKIEIKGTIEKSEKPGFNELKNGRIILLEWKYVK